MDVGSLKPVFKSECLMPEKWGKADKSSDQVSATVFCAEGPAH